MSLAGGASAVRCMNQLVDRFEMGLVMVFFERIPECSPFERD